MFEVHFVGDFPPTCSLVCENVYKCFAIGVTSAWGIKPDRKAEIILKWDNPQQEFVQDRFPTMSQSCRNFERAFYLARRNNTQFDQLLDGSLESFN